MGVPGRMPASAETSQELLIQRWMCGSASGLGHASGPSSAISTLKRNASAQGPYYPGPDPQALVSASLSADDRGRRGLDALVTIAGRFPEQFTQVSGDGVHAARPSPRGDMAVRPDQDERPGAEVPGCRSRRDDLKVAPV